MCGIAGFAGRGERAALERMGAALDRRGPDDEGFYEEKGVGFAFRRLSIIDVAGGHQPLSNETGKIWVMLNGEIYGFGALRDELEQSGHRFATRSDTEVIVHAYEEWGDACFGHLNGMFAIALWDAEHSRLILARDRLGKKPLYWTMKDGVLFFASEAKALIAGGAVAREIDLVSLGLYFRTDAVPTPRSIFKGVNKMEPATAQAWRVTPDGKVVDDGGWQFWSCPREDLTGVTPDEAVSGLRARLDMAVQERLISDVPLGLFLSGGLDSAVVAEAASRLSPRPLKAFTIGFDEASHDERPAARRVAQAFGLEHLEETLKVEDALAMLGEAVDILDEPLADSSILPQLLLSRFTRSHVTVALSGDGGDELLLGYQHVAAHAMIERLNFLPAFIRTAAAPVLAAVPAGTGYFSLGFKTQRLARGLMETDPWSRDVAWRGAFVPAVLEQMLAPDIRSAVRIRTADEELSRRAQEAGEGAGFWKAWSWAYLRTFLMDEVMVKVDRATMGFGLEGRAPLLDPRVVSYLLTLPDGLKLGAWKNKRLFKEVLREKLPREILDRPKHGFAVPIAKWLRGPLAERLHGVTESGYLKSQGLFSPSGVARLVAEHQSGKTDRRKELWALFMFQLWYERWFAHLGQI